MTPLFDATHPPLNAEQFRLLRDLVNQRTGLYFDETSMFLFERRLGDRLAALQLPDFDEYYHLLRFDARGATELEEAIELLTTKETYFFRQDYQLRAFSDELLPRLAESNAESRRLSIWSAGCATGEEAYTLAIVVHESGLFKGWDVRIVGSDISRASVAKARHGAYRSNSFRVTTPEMLGRYFIERADGFHVADFVKEKCHFGQLNLLDGTRAMGVGRVDVVMCRNVIIYFDTTSRTKVIDHLYERLVPGGYLLLGHAESLINLSTAFELVHLKEDLVYRRPTTGGRTGAKAR
jgi:chemotaxis protein methyltransferase CheR